MSAKSYLPSSTDLAGAPKKVAYELQMFRNSTAIFLGLPESRRDRNLHNISLEAALLHARNLLDFFCGGQTPKDDIRAAHFVPSSALSKGQDWWSSTKLPTVNSMREDMNKSLSHLTYTRVGKKPSWDLAKFQEELEAAYKEFKSLLPEEERKLWVV